MRGGAGMLAELGYVALAVDLYGEGYLASTQEETMKLMEICERIRRRCANASGGA